MLREKKTDNTVFKNKWSWIIIITMFIAMLIVFILCGELNVLKLNWLVATNGKKWGEVKQEDGSLAEGFGINPGAPIVGWEIFVIMGAILLAAIIAMIVLMVCHQLHFSSFAFIIASWATFFTIIVSGLLYPAPNASFQWQILVRIIVIFVSYPIVFFPFSWIFKKMFINTKYGEDYVDNLLSAEKENAKYIHEIEKSEIKRKDNEVETVELSDKEI